MPLSDEFLAKWDHIISEVEKTQVPLKCINKMVIRIAGGKQKTINLSRLRRDGLDDDEIEEIMNRNIFVLGDSVNNIDFILDVNTVAGIIQPATDKLLKSL
jgi:hypothetical protein